MVQSKKRWVGVGKTKVPASHLLLLLKEEQVQKRQGWVTLGSKIKCKLEGSINTTNLS